jgi:hypothetical protein
MMLATKNKTNCMAVKAANAFGKSCGLNELSARFHNSKRNGPLHLSDERRVENLSDPKESDIERSVHAIDEGGLGRSGRGADRPQRRPVSTIAEGGMILDAAVHPSQEQRHAHRQG